MDARRLARLRDQLANALPSTMVSAVDVARVLEEALEGDEVANGVGHLAEPPPWTWRERLWACPAETLLGTQEVAEALDRSKHWVDRACSGKWAKKRGRAPLPYSKLDGVRTFRAGELRAWLRTQLEVVVESVSTEAERHGWRQAS